MGVTVRTWDMGLDGRRVDGQPWTIRFHELTGDRPGPATAIVAGTLGDKPLGVLAVHEVKRRLADVDLAGTVVLVPAANPFGLQNGTRANPDLLELNRRFPGRPHGFLTDQLAHLLLSTLLERVDFIVDLHSGTPGRALNYTYDYGDVELTASFAYLPVVVDRHVPGQMSYAAIAAGAKSFLAEFGGASLDDPTPGVEGCLNTLRYRGHLDGDPTGPGEVPILDQIKVFLASYEGALDGVYGPADVGSRVDSGAIGWITNMVTGERMEEFVVERVGETTGMGPGFDLWGPGPMQEFTVAEQPFLMLAPSKPAMVRPGEFAYAVGWPREIIPTPRR